MKLFVLLSRFPYPLEKGDKLRAYHQIRQLSRNNNIILCALTESNPKQSDIDQLKPFCTAIHIIKLNKLTIAINIVKAFFTGKPLQVGYFYSHRAKKKILSLINDSKPDHIFCQLLRVSAYVKDFNIPKTLDYQDVFSAGVARRSKTSPLYMKLILKSEYKRLLRYENMIFDYFDYKTIISTPDRDLIPHPEKDKIVIIPNGVDHDFFHPMEVEKEYDVVFIGNMGYPPNVNAAEYLVKKILPIVHRSRPEVKVMLAGANPHANVVALKSQLVTVTGWVDDIRECYAKARLFIAPMQIGTGLQNKILEAMAMKIPCISSSLANDALNAESGNEILIGDSPEEFASHILNLLENREKAEKIATNGFRFVNKKFDWKAATQKLEELWK